MIKNGILHVHSMYSLHDSTQSPEDIVRWASEHGCKNITLTGKCDTFRVKMSNHRKSDTHRK